jgi:hypothetical protein
MPTIRQGWSIRGKDGPPQGRAADWRYRISIKLSRRDAVGNITRVIPLLYSLPTSDGLRSEASVSMPLCVARLALTVDATL